MIGTKGQGDKGTEGRSGRCASRITQSGGVKKAKVTIDLGGCGRDVCEPGRGRDCSLAADGEPGIGWWGGFVGEGTRSARRAGASTREHRRASGVRCAAARPVNFAPHRRAAHARGGMSVCLHDH
jgi:hypothetical protein